MYVEFILPSGSGGMAAGYTAMGIRKALKSWSEQHDIAYKEHPNRGYKFLITFDAPEHYTTFALTYSGKRPWTIIDEDLPKKLSYKEFKL